MAYLSSIYRAAVLHAAANPLPRCSSQQDKFVTCNTVGGGIGYVCDGADGYPTSAAACGGTSMANCPSSAYSCVGTTPQKHHPAVVDHSAYCQAVRTAGSTDSAAVSSVCMTLPNTPNSQGFSPMSECIRDVRDKYDGYYPDIDFCNTNNTRHIPRHNYSPSEPLPPPIHPVPSPHLNIYNETSDGLLNTTWADKDITEFAEFLKTSNLYTGRMAACIAQSVGKSGKTLSMAKQYLTPSQKPSQTPSQIEDYAQFRLYMVATVAACLLSTNSCNANTKCTDGEKCVNGHCEKGGITDIEIALIIGAIALVIGCVVLYRRSHK